MNTRFLHTPVREQAHQRPDDRAVVDGDTWLTYGELEEQSNRLASFLVAEGLAPGDRVLILAPKSPDTIAALVAVSKAGGVYVPVDPTSPAPRLAKIATASTPRWILSTPCCAAILDGLLHTLAADGSPLDARVVSLGGPIAAEHLAAADAAVTSAADWIAAGSPDAAAERCAPEDLAHLLFTSGSTGVPKGVGITHDNVMHFVDWGVNHFGFTAKDRHSAHAPLHFDLSTFDVYGTLSVGAELHVPPAEAGLMPHRIADFIRDAELTQWFSVPSVLTYLAKLDVIENDDFPQLKRILWCGEVLPTPTLIHFMERVPHAQYANLYGPTEATIASTFFDVKACPTDPSKPIPIGVPCDGEGVVIVDEQLQEVPHGDVGELCITGEGLSPGYWEDPDKTDQVFVTGPDGSRMYRTGDLARIDDFGILHFVGRADTQIKSRGYRIELGEIEAALHTLPDLSAAAVVALPTDGFEGHVICCAFSPADGVTVRQMDVRKQLAALLPTYMLPARWLQLDALPENANGKVDRPALRAQFEQELART